jgi:hypothetical protein
MASEPRVTEGYLVVGDISGYTRFLTGTELEHAQSIVNELTTLVRACLAPPLRFVKLEGDAVLCCAEPQALTDGERLLELLEVCYIEFVLRRDDMARSTTCTCHACTSIAALDLKFVAHYGRYMEQLEGGVYDIAGPDVIVVHRLLKNSITEQTGIRAYVFFTDVFAAALPPELALQPHAQEYEELGEVSGAVYDLAPVLEGRRHGTQQSIRSEEADFEHTGEVDATPAVLWPYFIEPRERLRWQVGINDANNQPNDRGRLGVGATIHCDHGSWSSEQRIVDWRPFEYFTTVSKPVRTSFSAAPPMLVTTEFVPTGAGRTRVSYRFRLDDRGLLSGLTMRAFAPFVRRQFDKQHKRLEELLRRDGVATA